MNRDEEFAQLAREYAAAEAEYQRTAKAVRDAEQARTDATQRADGLTKKLAVYVGANITTRVCILPGDRVVLVQYRGDNTPARVAVVDAVTAK